MQSATKNGPHTPDRNAKHHEKNSNSPIDKKSRSPRCSAAPSQRVRRSDDSVSPDRFTRRRNSPDTTTRSSGRETRSRPNISRLDASWDDLFQNICDDDLIASTSYVDSKLGSLFDSISKDTAILINQAAENQNAQAKEVATKICARFDKEQARLEHKVDAMDQELRKLTLRAESQGNEQAELRKGLAMAENATVTKDDLDADDYDRSEDPSILRINTHGRKDVSITDVKAALSDWIDEDSGGSITGPDIGKNFIIQFSGSPTLAARKQKEAHGGLRRNGEWVNYSCKPISGSAEVPLYISVDKSPARVACEIHLRTSSRLIMEQIGTGITPQVLRHEFKINYQFKPLCRVSSVIKGKVEVYWDAKYAESLSLDTEAIKKAIEAEKAGKETSWTQQL